MRLFIREQTSGSSPPIMMHNGVRQVGHEDQPADLSLREVKEKYGDLFDCAFNAGFAG